jgi:hypothetical protein
VAQRQEGGQEQEQLKDLTRAKIIKDFLKKEMEYVRELQSFAKVCI